MYRKEVNQRSPLRILERSTKSGVGPGNLGVIMARAGVGKTAFLVQIGIDDAMRRRPVLHVALGQDLDHVQSWYQALFNVLADSHDLEERERVGGMVREHRLIQAYPQTTLSADKLRELVGIYRGSLGFEPQAILIDGLDWEKIDDSALRAAISGFKELAAELGSELWISAQTHRVETSAHPTQLTAPCDALADLIDVAVFLEPEGRHITVRLLKDHDSVAPADTPLQLQPDTMQLTSEDDEDTEVRLPAKAFTVLTGGAKGAENAFGECAERWGLGEVTFTFSGRDTRRKRGLITLSEEELERGRVSDAYLQAQLHRSFPKTETFVRILESIWHVVATASEIFVVGKILDDGTVKGGTGWGVELARHFHKRCTVFDQDKNGWFRWNGDSWDVVDKPRIRRTRFAGTGTRRLEENGRKAIVELFERSFGSPRS